MIQSVYFGFKYKGIPLEQILDRGTHPIFKKGDISSSGYIAKEMELMDDLGMSAHEYVTTLPRAERAARLARRVAQGTLEALRVYDQNAENKKKIDANRAKRATRSRRGFRRRR